MRAAIAVPKEELLVPEARAIAMVETCAKQLEFVRTIPDAMQVISQADAIHAVMQKIKASERAKVAALSLRIEAEAQLGRLTKKIPQGSRGPVAKGTTAPKTKGKVLAEHGVHNYRASVAEKLAETPPAKLAEAVRDAPSKSVYGVTAHLGYRKPWRDYQIPETTARNLGFLANEAIELLERCITNQQAPHSGTVAEFRRRLRDLQSQWGTDGR